MATVLQSRKSAETPKNEKFVENQLSQAESRIRRLDVTVGVLGLVAGLLGFTLTVVVLDRLFDLSNEVRQGLLFAFLGIASVYAWFAVVRPIRQRINPYYAAKQVEATLPEAKNSIVNYLDLKDEELSPAIKQAVGNRAAKDIREADLDEAIRGQHASRMSWLAGALFLAFIAALIFLRPTQFFSLLGRAFSPFESRTIATRTTVKVVSPDGGNTTVILGQSVLVQVHVEGRIPDKQADDALTLRLKYDAADLETIDLPLEEGADNRTYQLRLPTKTVRNGFWYTVTGGDGTTPEYRVAVKSLPLFEGFAVAFDYPKYLRWEPQQTNKVGCQDPIQAMQGTMVTLTAHTNRTVREGRLLIDGDKQPIAAQLVAGSPQSVQFTFRLERDANYRVFFTSSDGETNQDPKPYQLRVVSDLEPRIEWVAPPEEETSLPANDVLALEALATDDFGLDKMTLKMRVTEPFVAELEAKPYRAGKSFLREEDQSYPRRIEYKDNVDLAKVKGSDAKPFTLAEGMLVECWLEAIDNRKVVDAEGKDVLSANVGKSAVRRLRILPPKKDEPQKMEQKRQKLDQDKKKHEEKQDQQNKNEQRNPDQPEQEQPKENPQPEHGDPNAQKDPMKNGDPMMGDPMPMNMGEAGQPKPDKPMNMGENGEPKPDQPMKGDQGDSKDNPENKADQIEKAIDKGEKEKGKEKPDNQDRKDDERQPPAEQKGGGDMGMDKQDAGEPKGQPMPMDGQGGEQGEPKKKGELEKEPKKGQAKEMGDGDKEGGEQGEPKEQPFGGDAGDKKEKGQPDKAPNDRQNMGDPNERPMQNMGDPNDAQAKHEPGQKKGAGQKGTPKNEPGQPMEMNPAEQGNDGEKAPNAGQAKREPKPERGDAKQNGEPGEAGEPGQQGEAGKEPNAGLAKAEKPQPKGEAKAPPMGQPGQEAQAKNDGAGEQNGEPKSAPKPDPMKGQNQTAKGAPKPDNADPKKGEQGQGDAASEEQAKKEIEQLAKDLKSDDKATREAAERKLEDLKKQAAEAQKAQGDAGDKKDGDPMKGDQASEPKKGPPEGQDAQAAAPKGPPKQDGQPMGDQKADKGDPKAPEGSAKAPPMEKLGEGGECKECKNPGAGGNGKSAGKKEGMGQPKQGEQGTAKANKPEPGKGKEPGMGEPMNNMGDPTVNNPPMKNMGEPMDQKAENPEGADKPNPDQQAKGEPKGKNPGDGFGKWGNPEGNERTKPTKGGDNPQVRRDPVDEAAKRRATDLQLEKLKANADNEELLKKLNMTKEEYRRFLDSYEKAVQRKQADAIVRDDLKTGPKTGATAANRGTRRVEGENATEGDVNRVGPVFAPSEFRNPFKEFTEELSKVKPVQK